MPRRFFSVACLGLPCPVFRDSPQLSYIQLSACGGGGACLVADIIGSVLIAASGQGTECLALQGIT